MRTAVGAEVARWRRVVGQRQPGALDRLAGPAGRWRRRPRRAARSPSGAADRCARRPAGRRRPAGGWSWCRSRSPRPGVHAEASAWLAAARGARPGRPPLPHALDRAVADRIDPRPGGQRVPGQRVQALDPVGHPAGGAAGGQHVPLVAGGQVGLVRGAGTRRPAPGRWPARPATRASARPTPAGWRQPPPAGRSGSTASGTGCRPPAAARSRRRRAGRTGSGARRRRAPGAARPSWRPTISRSAGADRLAHSCGSAGGRRRPPTSDSIRPSYQGSGSAAVVASAGCRRRPPRPAAVDDDDQPVTRAGRRAAAPGPAARRTSGSACRSSCGLQLLHALVQRTPLGGQAHQLRPAGQVLPHRLGEGEREQQDERAQQRGPAGEEGRGARPPSTTGPAAVPTSAGRAARPRRRCAARAHRPGGVHPRRAAGGAPRVGRAPLRRPRTLLIRRAAHPASRGKAAAPA